MADSPVEALFVIGKYALGPSFSSNVSVDGVGTFMLLFQGNTGGGLHHGGLVGRFEAVKGHQLRCCLRLLLLYEGHAGQVNPLRLNFNCSCTASASAAVGFTIEDKGGRVNIGAQSIT